MEPLTQSVSYIKGYDIESKGKGGTRRFEANGRTSNLELTITTHQWRALLRICGH